MTGDPLALLKLLPLLLAITLHEAAHAYAAFKCGDGTAWWEGRMSLNPLVHMDLMGTVAVPLALLAATGVPFGWAKPVPVTFAFVKRYQACLIALAGPACNVVQAGVWFVLGYVGGVLSDVDPHDSMWIDLCAWGAVVNLVLAAVNMLPVLPLDGGRVLHSLLPARPAAWLVSAQPLAPWLLLLAVVILMSWR